SRWVEPSARLSRVFDALCVSPFATRMDDTHHVATCTRTAVDRYRPDDLACAPGEQTRTLKIEHAARRERHDDAHRPRRIGLRPRDPRDGRQRGSACGEMEKISAGKFHGLPLCNVGDATLYSALILAARITFAHLAVSDLMTTANSSGE